MIQAKQGAKIERPQAWLEKPRQPLLNIPIWYWVYLEWTSHAPQPSGNLFVARRCLLSMGMGRSYPPTATRRVPIDSNVHSCSTWPST